MNDEASRDRESATMDWQEADVAASGLHSPPFASDDDDDDWEQYDSDWEDYVDGSAEIAAIGAAAKLRVRARAASEQRAALIAAGGEKGEAADDGDDYRGEHETGQVAAEWADAERMTRNELERLHAELAAARVEQQKLKILNAVLQKQNAELAAWQPRQMFSAGEMMLFGINR